MCISIINHTLPSTIRAVISILTCTSMASNSMNDIASAIGRMSTCKSTVAALIIRGLKCVDNSIEFALGYSRSTNSRVYIDKWGLTPPPPDF